MSPSPTSFRVFDLETTSKYAQVARIVSWAVVVFELRHDGWHADPLQRLYGIVDPGVAIPPEATEIHGITDAMVAAAPTTAQSLPWVLRYLEGSVLVGYNLLEFDLEVGEHECRRHGLADQFTATLSTLRGVVDVMPWAARTTSLPLYRKGARTLSTMCALHGVALPRAHSAAEDAEATGQLMLSLMARSHMPVTLGEVVEATRSTWEHLL